MVICDPSYVQSMEGQLSVQQKVVRSICILDHPIPNTQDKTSCQIIIPQK